MGGPRQPFIYEAVQDDERFPTNTFDPKAVTRSSYEKKKPKPKPKGPLISVNRHPDSHAVPNGRMNFGYMGRRTKAWIKGMRKFQLVLRVLELLGAIGLLVLMVLINNVETLTGWVLRVTLAVAIVHTVYAVYHLSNPAGGRTPGSSAAYHVFAGISDVCVMPLYAYGALSARNQSGAGDLAWRTLLADQSKLDYFVPAVYYGLITAGSLHLVSLVISLWLGVMFRRITMLPPDMNPLESHLTSRAHKRNKSSIVTIDSERRLGTAPERPMSQVDLSRPLSVPFMHTRTNSSVTIGNDAHDARMDLPSRQYQIPHRNSISDLAIKRMSAPPTRGNYAEVPLGDPSPRPSSTYSHSRPPSTVPSHRTEIVPGSPTAQPRAAKFTEAWYASESLVGRTQQRLNAANKRHTYNALEQRYDSQHNNLSPDSDSDNENDYVNPNARNKVRPRSTTFESENEHPNPLRSHPTASEYVPGPPPGSPPETAAPARRPKTPFARMRNSVLSAINLNDRRVSGGGLDITDGRNRQSSIGLDSEFYSKPYGDLRAATPPVMIGGNNRQVSSGNDYDLGTGGDRRRHVSGKIAEEGRGGRFSRYEGIDE
ncbi:hypothetical protein OQA88_2753 [Cercophora sp. LCS_1]